MTKSAAMLAVVVVVALSVAAAAGLRRDNGSASLPTAIVARTVFVDFLQLRGEIRPVRSVVLTAPSTGADLQIVDLATNGAKVAAGDVVITFDPTTQQRTLETKQSELKQADSEIERTEAEQRRRVASAQSELDEAKKALARARLELQGNELRGRIEAENFVIAVSNAEEHVRELEKKIEGERMAAQADVAIARQKREKAMFDVRETERIIGSLQVRVPIAGSISLLPNFRAGGPGSRAAPEFKRGDRAWFGAQIAELPDLTSIQLTARVDEADRGRVQIGSGVRVRVDAVPDRDMTGTLKDISVVAKPDFTTWPPVRNFDVVVSLSDADPRLRSGMSASARVELDRLASVLRDAPRARSGGHRLWRRRGRTCGAQGAGRGDDAMMRTAAIAVVVLLVAVAGIAALRGMSPSSPKAVPTTHVQRGRVQVTVYTVGDLRASRAIQLAAPPMGGQLQIVRLAGTGDAVKAGDVVVEFDASEQEFNLEQARFDLQLAEQDVVKADAQTAVQVADDEVALLHARYDVRRGELDVQSNELVGAIKAQQNVLVLEEAKQRLAQNEADVKTHRETNQASADGLREKRNKAQLSVQVAERNIESLHVRAPFDGFATVRTNFQAFGGIYFGGAMPDYRVGDAAFAGQPIAEVIDSSRIEVTAKLQEQDRANVSPGQAVEVAVDALPDARLRGTVRTVSGVASRGIFDAGMRHDAREVRVRAWTDSVAVVENIEQSAEVALVDPNTPSGARPKTPAPAPQRASR